MLSNVATPRYYGEFRQRVLDGQEVVNFYISCQMNRIDDLIRNPYIYYDPEPVEGFIRFVEHEMTLADGSDAVMLPSFKLWAEDLFGWWYYIETQTPVVNHGRVTYVRHKELRRLRNTEYIITARNSAKTMFAAWVHAYVLILEPSTTQQIASAPTMNQAEETLEPIRTALVRKRGPLMKFMSEGDIRATSGNRKNRSKVESTKKGIQNFLTNSILFTRPMRIDRLQGYKAKCATLDEWLSCEIRENPVDAIIQGAGKNKDWILICISSEGTIRNGIGDEVKSMCMKILRGEFLDPHTGIWYYRLDSIDEVRDPTKWIKANPNLGITVSYEDYQRDVDKAEAVPSSRNDILAKRFGIPAEGMSYFFTYEETLAHPKREYWGMPCALGADMSLGDDFCAFAFLFPLPDGSFGIKERCYITSDTMSRLKDVMRNLYESFLAEGSLVVLEGVRLNDEEVYEDLLKLIDTCRYEVMAFGYDPYNIKVFYENYTRDFGEMGCTVVHQGARTESVPLGELKNFARNGLLHFDSSLMQFCMGNCIVLEDTNGNRKLVKDRRDKKIDAFAATMDAYVAWKTNPELFA